MFYTTHLGRRRIRVSELRVRWHLGRFRRTVFFFFLFVTLSQCLFGKLGHNRTCTHCTLSLSQYYYCRQHETNNESSEWSRYNANVRDCHQGVFESWPKNSTDDHMSNLVFAVVLGRREDVPARYPEYSRISNSNVPEIIVFTHRWIQSMAREKDVRWMGARFRSWKIRTRWEISGVEERGAQTRHTFGFRVTVREKRTGIEERCSGAMGRTFGQTTKRHERLVIELVRSFVRSFGPSPALTGHSSLRLTRHHSHHFSGLPLRSVPVPPLARKTESNVYPHHLGVGRGSYGTVQSGRLALPYGRVTWDGTWRGIGRAFGARASFRIELAHERDDAFRPTRRETIVKRSRRCSPRQASTNGHGGTRRNEYVYASLLLSTRRRGT